MKNYIAIILVGISVANASASMTPPVVSAQVIPGFSQQGLGASSGDGLGVYISAYQSARDTLRKGSDDVANPNGEKNLTRRINVLLDYRVIHNLSLSLALPYVYTKATFQQTEQTTHGLGDIALYGRYSLWRDRWMNARREWLLLAGVELPTGSTSERDNQGHQIAFTQQPGSGTTDAIVGTAFRWGFRPLSFHTEATYKINGHRAYTYGNIFSFNTGINVPFASNRFGLLADINSQFLNHDESSFVGAPGRDADGTVQNTGGEVVFFAPALQWRATPTWALTAGIEVPLYQNYRGTQLRSDVNYNLGFSGRFAYTSRHANN